MLPLIDYMRNFVVINKLPYVQQLRYDLEIILSYPLRVKIFTIRKWNC